MKVLAFRIKNFRSIVDSGWVVMSPDGITVLVGQNESGKSSVLEALACALSRREPTEDDFRIGQPLPSVEIRVEVDREAITIELANHAVEEQAALSAYLDSKANIAEVSFFWKRAVKEGKNTVTRFRTMVDGELDARLNKVREDAATTRMLAAALEKASADFVESTPLPTQPPATAPAPTSAGVTTSASGEKDEEAANGTISASLEAQHFVDAVDAYLPLGVLFNEGSGSLPNHVDILKGQPSGVGAQAAMNFLKVAGISLPDLVDSDLRGRNNTLKRANDLISRDFNEFWTQTIGKTGRLSLQCDIDNYDLSEPEKAGKPRLVFWIIDGNTQLYPKQRSQGVRWFISFYLQLKASEKSGSRRVFLLDEPGANLHSRAQGDVLKLINKLGKETSTVVYSTHSPELLEYDKLFRVHAVQRHGEQDESPTEIIDAHRLGTASSDTLSPVLAAMGANLSQHQVIQKENNVLLEEMSGYYYLSRLWRLTAQSKAAHFIAATGVNKIEALANMFIGWGLGFIVAVDDDKQGRDAFKSMKRELFGDDDTLASQRLLKLPGCPAIEDVFSKEDFKAIVLGDATVDYGVSNAEYCKAQQRSKPVLAFNFAIKVDRQEVDWNSFDADSKRRITTVLDAVAMRLKPLP